MLWLVTQMLESLQGILSKKKNNSSYVLKGNSLKNITLEGLGEIIKYIEETSYREIVGGSLRSIWMKDLD